jgi:hypothetical protein
MDKICSVIDCEREAKKRGYCQMHYQRFMKFGDPLKGGARYSSPDEATEKRVRKDGDCLVWTGHINAKGYPRINTGSRLELVYRYVWERENGPIPENAEIDHKCFNRACINLEHLRLSDRVANTRHRMGAQPNSISGVRNVHRRGNRWIVRLKSKGKHYEFGSFDTIEEAEVVARQARRDMFGTD